MNWKYSGHPGKGHFPWLRVLTINPTIRQRWVPNRGLLRGEMRKSIDRWQIKCAGQAGGVT
jgi:hypothetical protein